MGFFKSVVDFFTMASCKVCNKDFYLDDDEKYVRHMISIYDAYGNENLHGCGNYMYRTMYDRMMKKLFPESLRIIHYNGNLEFDRVCPDCYEKWVSRITICKEVANNIINDNIIKRAKKLIDDECFSYILTSEILQTIFEELIDLNNKDLTNLISLGLCIDNMRYSSNDVRYDYVDVLIKIEDEININQVEEEIVKFKFKHDRAMMNKSNVKLYNVNYGKDLSYLKGKVFSIPCGSRKTVVVYDTVKFFAALWGYDMAYNVCYNGDTVSGVMVRTRK